MQTELGPHHRAPDMSRFYYNSDWPKNTKNCVHHTWPFKLCSEPGRKSGEVSLLGNRPEVAPILEVLETVINSELVTFELDFLHLSTIKVFIPFIYNRVMFGLLCIMLSILTYSGLFSIPTEHLHPIGFIGGALQ